VAEVDDAAMPHFAETVAVNRGVNVRLFQSVDAAEQWLSEECLCLRMAYQLTIEERPTYVYAKATGERTPANALRFLEEAYVACVKSGRPDLLLDMQFTGPSLNTTSIYQVISQRVPDGRNLRKIAYVDDSIDFDPGMPVFAETVAVNRGVNVRLFQSVELAEEWLLRASDS
jgi:hypothetical protein